MSFVYALACSGPDAERTIEQHELDGVLYAMIAVGVVALLALAMFAIRRRIHGKGLGVTAIVAVASPGWWLSARMGDCGHLKHDAGAVWIGVTVIVAGLALWRSRVPRLVR